MVIEEDKDEKQPLKSQSVVVATSTDVELSLPQTPPPATLMHKHLLTRLSSSVRSLPAVMTTDVPSMTSAVETGDGYAVQACASTGDLFIMPSRGDATVKRNVSPHVTTSCDALVAKKSDRKKLDLQPSNSLRNMLQPAVEEPLLILPDSAKDVLSDESQSSATVGWCTKIRRSKVGQVLSNPDARLSVAIYCLSSFSVIGYDEVFAVFASTDRRLGEFQSCVLQLLFMFQRCLLYV